LMRAMTSAGPAAKRPPHMELTAEGGSGAGAASFGFVLMLNRRAPYLMLRD